MNQEELLIRVEPGKHVQFQAVDSQHQSTNNNSFELVILPLNCSLLTTRYFRLHSGIQISHEEKRFASISWEVFNILKENFPSKVLLFQENLDLCKPIYLPLSSSEELRRQISCIMSLKEDNRALTLDELEDLWHTLAVSEKLNDQKAISVSLELVNMQLTLRLQGKIELCNFFIDEDLLSRIISKSETSQQTLQSIKTLAQEILTNFHLSLRQIDEGVQMTSLLTSESSEMSVSAGTTLAQQYQGLKTAQEKQSTRMSLFQLSESNDINRVTVILKNLTSKSRDSIIQLRKKYNLSHKLITILKKYCNADFGFDHVSSKNGSFQYYLTKLMILLASDYAVFLEYLQSSTLDWLSQMIEEAVIYAHDKAIQGSTNDEKEAYLHRFLRLSLDLMDLAVSKNFAEFIPLVRDNLHKVHARFVKVIQKKEQNPIIQYFIKLQGTNEGDMGTVSPNKLSYDQMINLKGMSDGLYIFCVELQTKLQRVEGLNDTLFENHEDKYTRLFPFLAARTLGSVKPRIQMDEQIVLETNHRAVQFTEPVETRFIQVGLNDNQNLPTKQQQYESLPTFSGCGMEEEDPSQFQDTFERQLSHRENQENLSTNVYLKNKIEQGFKRVVNQSNGNQQVNSHQQLKPRSTKEISEPIIMGQQRSRENVQTIPKIDTSSSGKTVMMDPSRYSKYL